MYSLHNYHSLAAILHGLKLANFESPRLSDLWPLISAEQDYAFYRKALARTGGIPFLFPHVEEAHDGSHQEKVIQELFYSNTDVVVGQKASVGSQETPVESYFEVEKSREFWEWAELIFCSITSVLRRCYGRSSA